MPFKSLSAVACLLLLGACVSSPSRVAAAAPAPAAAAAPVSAPQPAPALAPAAARAQALASDAPAVAQAAPAADAAAEGPTPKEQQFLENYLKRLKYLVVIKEGSSLSASQKRGVLAKANEYLLRQGYTAIDYDQLLKNMEDQRAAFASEAGHEMGFIQFLAQKLGADVYVELDAQGRSWTDAGKNYGESSFTASMFDPSTAEMLASVAYKSDRVLSNTSPDDALFTAFVAGTAQFMPRIVKDSAASLRTRYAGGIRYQLVVQKTQDARALASFRRALRSKVKEIQAGPSAQDQAAMDVFLFGTISDLEDACYSAFDKTPGFENAYVVYSRGKSITFSTGN